MHHAGACRGEPGFIREQKEQGERVGENFIVPFTRKTKRSKVSRCVHAKLLQSYPTLCGCMDCSLPDSSVHGILQARILEWVAMLSSRESSKLRDQTHISYISCTGATWEAPTII